MNRYLLWIGSDQKNTFGPVVSDLVDGLGPDRFMIWDAKQRGMYNYYYKIVVSTNFVVLPFAGRRPDLIELIGDIYQFWGAEVIFIFSNYQGVKEMTRGCREAGFPAFVSVFCSIKFDSV